MSYSVTEILQKARAIIETNDEIGGYIQIKGEVGTFKVYGKHAYLSLKEENALLKCVYFMVPKEISTTINEGSIVEAYGYLSIYEIRGELQFYIKSMREISKAGLLML
jgi:exodeoxyribonuclease VII large subunit